MKLTFDPPPLCFPLYSRARAHRRCPRLTKLYHPPPHPCRPPHLHPAPPWRGQSKNSFPLPSIQGDVESFLGRIVRGRDRGVGGGRGCLSLPLFLALVIWGDGNGWWWWRRGGAVGGGRRTPVSGGMEEEREVGKEEGVCALRINGVVVFHLDRRGEEGGDAWCGKEALSRIWLLMLCWRWRWRRR